MEYQTKKKLTDLTSEFYAETAKSFSETRSAPWHGWRTVVDVMCERYGRNEAGSSERVPLQLLDIGCGNLRFEKYVAECGIWFDALCVDNCASLVEEGLAGWSEDGACNDRTDGHPCIRFHEANIAHMLLDGVDIADALSCTPGSFDVVCAFGFFHHIPGEETRQVFLRSLGNLVAPGGILVVSFWQFERDARIVSRAKTTTLHAQQQCGFLGLEEGDYLLGWKEESSVFRYCHSFSKGEIARLSAQLSPDFREVAAFSADGKSGDLNRYVLWENTSESCA